MPEFQFDCPSCDKLLSVGEEFAGVTAACPSCGETITAPELADRFQLEVEEEKPPEPPAEKKENPVDQESKKEVVTKPAKKPLPEKDEIDLDDQPAPRKNLQTQFSILGDERDRSLDPANMRSIVDLQEERAISRKARRERHRVRKAISPRESFSSRLARHLPAILVGVIGIATLITMWVLLGDSKENEKAEEKKTDAPFSERARLVADQFLKETSPYKRLAYARNPNEVALHLGHYHPQAQYGQPEKLDSFESEPIDGLNYATYLATFPGNRNRFLYVLDTPSGPKVDWDSYARHGTLTWKEILSAREPVTANVRVYLQIADHYQGKYSDQSIWSCYRILSPDIKKPLYAYTNRLSTDEQLLRAEHRGRTYPQVRVIAKIYGEPDTTETGQFFLEKIITKGWIKK